MPIKKTISTPLRKVGRPPGKKLIQESAKPTSSFFPLSDAEKETVREACRRARFEEQELERLLNAKVAYYQQDNFTVCLLLVGGEVRIGVSKRNPTKLKTLQVQVTEGKWVDFNLAGPFPEGFEMTHARVKEEVVDKPNPQVGRTVALARAVKGAGLIL